MIYKELLVDPRGVHIKHQPSRHRRLVFHCHPELCLQSWVSGPCLARKCKARSRPPSLESLSGYLVRQKSGLNLMFNSDEAPIRKLHYMKDMQRWQRNDQGPGRHYKIWPNILATNKAIYAETAHILYGQSFSFSDTHALFEFLAALGPAPLAKLGEIDILGWADQRSIMSEAVPAFALLAQVTNLRKLRIACSLGHTEDWAWANIFPPRYYEQRPGSCYQLPMDIVASKVYRDCQYWLRPVFAAKGIRGVRKVLRVDKKNLMPLTRSSPKAIPPFTDDMEEKMQARFWAYLEILLEGKVA